MLTDSVSTFLNSLFAKTLTLLGSLGRKSYSFWLSLLLIIYILLLLIFWSTGETLFIVCSTISFDLFLLFWLATRRLLLSFFVVSLSLVGLYGIAIYKRLILDSPFLAHDIYFFLRNFGDNLSVVHQYPKIFLVVLASFCFFIICGVFLFKKERPMILSKSLGLTVLSFIAFSTPPVANTYESQFTNQEFIDQIKFVGNTTDYFSKFITSFAILESDLNVGSVHGSNFRPTMVPTNNDKADIIAILHESSFNLQSIKDCPASFCNIDLFKEDKKTLQSGFLKVHVMGGNTWLSEFAFLTGLDHRIFGENGKYAPYTIAPRLHNSLVRNLKAQGYRTIAINPIEGDFINATAAYKHYGFDEVYSKEDLGFGDDWLKIFDADVYNKAIDFIKKRNPSTPLFIYVLTIQNHGPHEEYIEGKSPILPYHGESSSKSSLEVYRQRYNQSIQDVNNFEHFLLNRHRKTILIRFGDHQPSFDGSIEDLEFNYPFKFLPADKNYYTKYIIKSNFRGHRKATTSHQDLALVPSDVLRYAGVPLNPFFLANQTVKQKCLGKYMNCETPQLFESYLGFIFGNLKIYQ